MSKAASTPLVESPRGGINIKKAAWISLGVLGLLLGLLLIVPHFIDLGIFKRTYLPLLEDALNRRIDVNEVHLSLVPTPSIRLSSLKISDSAAFADNTFFSAQQVQLKLKFLPLLRGHFEITELVLDKPIVNLLKQADGSFNYSDIASKKAPAGPRREARKKIDSVKPADAAALLIIPDRLRIQDGQLNLATKGQTPVNIKGIDLSIQEFHGSAPFPYRTSFNYPGLKTVSLDGELSYQEDKALIELKNNRLKILDLTVPVQGSISNLATVPRVNLSLSRDGVDAGTIFQILANFGLAPRDTEISGPMDVQMSLTGPSHSLITQIRGLFKDVKVNGKRAVKGILNGEVNLRLPLGGGAVSRRLQGNGKLVARDGELTNVDLTKKIQRITGMIGFSKDERRQATTFKILESDFTVAGGIANFSRVHMVNPQMEVDGSGTMTIDQPTLDMEIRTALAPQASARAGRARATNFLKDSQGRVVVPLKITGPVENPAVNLQAEKLFERGVPANVEKGFSSFFKGLFRSR